MKVIKDGVKRDCFAYIDLLDKRGDITGGHCKALSELYCIDKHCRFYKTKETLVKQMCDYYKNDKKYYNKLMKLYRLSDI